MNINLLSIPRKQKKISTPGFKGLGYLEALNLYRNLAGQDPHFAEYVLKPATDEMWNLINEERNVREIIEYSMLEFDLRIEPQFWLPVFAGWQKSGLISTQEAK